MKNKEKISKNLLGSVAGGLSFKVDSSLYVDGATLFRDNSKYIEKNVSYQE